MTGVPEIRDLLVGRVGEEMALNDCYLNPQMGRILRTLGFDRSWVGGDRAHLIDSNGERYLDLISGYGVFALGRNHPDVILAVQEVLAAGTANLPQLGVTLLSGVLAEQLLARAPGSVAAMVPANTGTEAVEAAMKIARAATGRPRLLYADHAFHGLTLGALSLNGNDEFRAGFGPLVPGCDAIAFGDAAALEVELARGDVAALIIEPVQGKGVHLPPDGYLAAAQRLCRDSGALFVCDEVQTGLGRTGRFLALEHWDLAPDMICLAKALSGGLVPIGAVLVSRDVFDRVFDGMERAVRHGSTFGGNDLAAAAALATLRVLERDGVVAHAERMGALLLELTKPLIERHEVVRDVRGLGLMWAIELGAPARGAGRSLFHAVERAQPGLFAQLIAVPLFHEHQILCQVAGHRMNVVKALPSLLIEEREIRPLCRRHRGRRGSRRSRAARDGPLWAANGARHGAISPFPAARCPAMRALVTGAAGFIGGHVVAALAGGGVQVRAFDRKPPPIGALPDTVEFIRGDVLDHDEVRRAVDGCDAVFHLAGVYSYDREDAALMQSVNVCGTRTVLDASVRGKRRRIVHTSSCATCGPARGRHATERDLPAPRELGVPYKRTKVQAERLALQAAREGAEVIVVNPTAPVGPGDLRPTPTGKMVADVARGRARAYLARSALNVVAVEDVARGHVAAFERGRAGERYLLGGDNMTVREVFAAIARAAGLPAPRMPVPWIAAYASAARRRRGAQAAGPRAKNARAGRGTRRAPAPSLR